MKRNRRIIHLKLETSFEDLSLFSLNRVVGGEVRILFPSIVAKIFLATRSTMMSKTEIFATTS